MKVSRVNWAFVIVFIVVFVVALFFQGEKSKARFFKVLLLWVLVHSISFTFAQKMDSMATQQAVGRFSTGASVTNNGVSLIPSFSLGKPAAIFDLSLGKKRLSFEPQFRFALSGKPWSFLFWWRYKLIQAKNLPLMWAHIHPLYFAKGLILP